MHGHRATESNEELKNWMAFVFSGIDFLCTFAALFKAF